MGCDYHLANGYGLPQQILSQTKPLLAEPVRSGCKVPAKNRADGRACRRHFNAAARSPLGRAGRSRASGRERQRHAGLRRHDAAQAALARREAGIDRPRGFGWHYARNWRLPREQALFLNTATDQGYWWYSFKGRLPETPGVVHTNLKQKAGKTQFLFFTLLFNHETGLEWFADDLADWQVDLAKPIQEIVRQSDGSVLLRCHLANQPFKLDRPLEITFGYDATPIKPLPADWRSIYCHYHEIQYLKSDLAVWWLWSSANYNRFRPNFFSLEPDDVRGFARQLDQASIESMSPSPISMC